MKLLTKMLFTKQSGLVLVLLAASGSLSAAQIANNNITEAEIKAAQDAWGKALIQISDDYRSGGIDPIFQRWFGLLGRPGPMLHAMFYLNTLPP